MTAQQLRIVIIAGVGFFTDAYDLFVIGVALKFLGEQWVLTPLDVAMLGATALVSAALGSLILGRLADKLGRTTVYGSVTLVLAFGALASAFAPNIWWLVAARFILGLGIGGDYPVSATIASEFGGANVRGRMISMVFAMQGLGLVVAPLLAMGLLALGTPHDLAWRLLLGFGAIPPLAVFWARRNLKEPPGMEALPERRSGAIAVEPNHLFGNPKFVMWLVGVSCAWFFLDFAYYGNTISNVRLVAAVTPKSAGEMGALFISLLIFVVAALPGYVLSVIGMDRWGHKRIQLLGFAMMALTFGAIALLGDGEAVLIPFVLLYAMNYFFTEFGPNTTTFVYPAEIFPLAVRATSHGIAATCGKAGAAIGTFSFPLLQATFHVAGPMWAAGIASAVGFAITWRLLPQSQDGEATTDLV